MNPLVIVGGGVALLWLLMQRNEQAQAEAARRAAAQRAAEQQESDGGSGSAEEWIQKGGQYVGLAATAVGIGTKIAGWLGLTGSTTGAGAAVVGSAASEAAAIAAAEAAALGAAETSALAVSEAAALFAVEGAVAPTSGIIAGAGAETAFVATETVAVAGAETGAVGGAAVAEVAFIGTVASGTLVLAGVGAVVIAIMVSEMIEQQRVMRKRMRRLGDAHDFTARIMQPFIDAKTYEEVKAGFAQWSGSDGIQIGNAIAGYAIQRHGNEYIPWNQPWLPRNGAIADMMAMLGYPGQFLITVRDVNSVYEASADDRLPAWEAMMNYLDQIFTKFEPDYPNLLARQQKPPIMVHQVVKEAEIISGVGAQNIVRMWSLSPDYEGPLYRVIPMVYGIASVDEAIRQAAYLISVGSYGGGPVDLGSASP